MTKVLLISDSHGCDRTQMSQLIKKVKPNISIHAGDFCDDFSFIEDIFDHIVRGNNDFYGLHEKTFQIENLKFVLMHGHTVLDGATLTRSSQNRFCEILDEKNAKVLIFGHTHIEEFFKCDDKILLNPGSIRLPRNKSGLKTYFVFHVNDDKIVEKSLEEVINYI